MNVSQHINKDSKIYPTPSLGLIGRWKQFMAWCVSQEKNRMAWLAGSLFAHGCVLFPMTVLINGMAGNSIALLVLSISALVMMFTANLSQLPERIILPSIFFSCFIDLVIILICIFEGLHASYLFQR